MSDAGQRGVKVDEIATDVVRIARQSFCTGEGATEHDIAQVVLSLKLAAVLLKAGFGLGRIVLDGILTVARLYTIQDGA